VSVLFVAVFSCSSWAGEKAPAVPELTLEHKHPSGSFSFRTPEGWKVQPSVNDELEAWGGELGVRFRFKLGEDGLDALHADCIDEGLAPLSQADPGRRFDYEYVGGIFADRRVLDTAHSMRYDTAVHGVRDWHQRTLTLVGAGQSMCIIAYAPSAAWKGKKSAAKATLNAVMSSVTFPR
jgi:hypothetical protein